MDDDETVLRVSVLGVAAGVFAVAFALVLTCCGDGDGVSGVESCDGDDDDESVDVASCVVTERISRGGAPLSRALGASADLTASTDTESTALVECGLSVIYDVMCVSSHLTAAGGVYVSVCAVDMTEYVAGRTMNGRTNACLSHFNQLKANSLHFDTTTLRPKRRELI